MQPIEKNALSPKQNDPVEYVQAVQTAVGLLYLIFTQSIPDFQYPTGNLSAKRITAPEVKEILCKISLFEAKVVLEGWDSYIEYLAKEAEVSKAANKKYHQRKEELELQTQKIQIEKQDILCKETLVTCR